MVYYYNDGNGWIKLDGDTYTVSKAGSYKLTFKAVSNNLESYESPAYNVILTTSYFTTVFKTTVLESQTAADGNTALSGVKVYVNDELVGTTDENGKVECLLKSGDYSVLFDNGTFSRTQTVSVTEDAEINAPMVALDLNKDGIVNAKDFAMIKKLDNADLSSLYSKIFANFINVSQDTFSYTISD